MVQPFIVNDDSRKVAELKEEIGRLKENILRLEMEISFIQKQCKHVFFECSSYRKCTKCQLVEVLHY